MTPDQVLKKLYDPAMVGNCQEYLEGLEQYPPDGYGDSSLKEWWQEAEKLIQSLITQERERCAQIAESFARKDALFSNEVFENQRIQQIAQAIRSKE